MSGLLLCDQDRYRWASLFDLIMGNALDQVVDGSCQIEDLTHKPTYDQAQTKKSPR